MQSKMDRVVRSNKRRAGVLIYSIMTMTAFSAFISLGVEFGRVQVVKTELQRCADSSAHAAAAQLSAQSGTAAESSAARQAAVSLAAMHTVDGKAFSLVGASDVTIGNWDTTMSPNFSAARTPANAVKVTAQCVKARGTAVDLPFSSALGLSSMNVSVTSIAYIEPPSSPHGLVGLDRIRFASLGVLASVDGDLISNGDIDVGYPLGLLVGVHGDARSTHGVTRKGFLAGISGSTSTLNESLYYPAVKLPALNNNEQIFNCLNWNNDFTVILGATIPGGTYVVRNLNILAGVDLNIEGPVTFYVTGSVNLAAGVNLLGHTSTSPANFKVRVLNGGSVNFLANLLTPLYMDLYAPQSDIDLNVSVNHYTGRIVGKTLDVNIPAISQITEDLSGRDGSTVGLIRLVK